MDNSTLRNSFVRVFDTDNEVYSVRVATVFCMILSALLWWIPVLGPAVAGYVCGRKTGSFVKGTICSLISGVVLMLVIWGLSAWILGHGGYPEIPADEAASSLTGILGAAAAYLSTFFVEGTSSLNLLNLGIVTAFGAVGGILSRQMRKEAAYLISAGANEAAVRPAARSMQLYAKGKQMGFESFSDCMTMQRMTTNDNKGMGSKMNTDDNKNKMQTMRPVTTTVQTVTTTVSGKTSSGDGKDSEGPFSDILERSERKKE